MLARTFIEYTALLSANGFLQLNGYRLIATDDEHADMILAMLTRAITTDEFKAQFVETVEANAPLRRTSRLRAARLDRQQQHRWRIRYRPRLAAKCSEPE